MRDSPPATAGGMAKPPRFQRGGRANERLGRKKLKNGWGKNQFVSNQERKNQFVVSNIVPPAGIEPAFTA